MKGARGRSMRAAAAHEELKKREEGVEKIKIRLEFLVFTSIDIRATRT